MLLLVSEIFIRDKISFIVICGIYFLHKYIYIYIYFLFRENFNLTRYGSLLDLNFSTRVSFSRDVSIQQFKRY